MDNSPLSKLPAEIRNQIYDLALRNNNCKITRQARLFCSSQNQHPLTLAQTCRVVRQETRLTFFAANCFTIDDWLIDRGIDRFYDFIKKIGGECEHSIRPVKIRASEWQCCFCDDPEMDEGREGRCIYCHETFEKLAGLHMWCLQHPRIDLKVGFLNLTGPGYFQPDLEHFCNAERAKAWYYLVNYGEAYSKGLNPAEWDESEKLTGLGVKLRATIPDWRLMLTCHRDHQRNHSALPETRVASAPNHRRRTGVQTSVWENVNPHLLAGSGRGLISGSLARYEWRAEAASRAPGVGSIAARSDHRRIHNFDRQYTHGAMNPRIWLGLCASMYFYSEL